MFMKKITILSQKPLSPCYIKYGKYIKQGENSKKYINLKRNWIYRPSFTILASYGSGGCPCTLLKIDL